MRSGGPLQAGIITIGLGLVLRHHPAGAPRSIWPYLLFCYALLAAFVPWAISIPGRLVQRDDLSARYTILLGILVALPAYLAGRWLTPTAYRPIGQGCWLLVAGWCAHVIATIVAAFVPADAAREELP